MASDSGGSSDQNSNRSVSFSLQPPTLVINPSIQTNSSPINMSSNDSSDLSSSMLKSLFDEAGLSDVTTCNSNKEIASSSSPPPSSDGSQVMISSDLSMEVDEVTNTRKRHSSEEIEAQGRSSTSPPKRSTVSTSSTSKSRVSPRPKNAEDALGACSQDSTSAAANLKSAPKYRPQDNGPYAVYVYDLNREKATHPFVISSIIANSGIPDIQEIKKIGKGKILIEAKSATAANRLVDNPTFSKHNLKAFIPAFRVIREGVIQDEPVELELEYIHRHIETPTAKILDIHRLNRRITINELDI
ncbi:PREDICTED: dentin sialophosphoprotein-like [Trachymyrmex cornetzi]|uniref:dentin sialophosphoprotein-like n=1 Tax=Trachymyrmex cornetzi TaxID=471704 RepID=UPI00084F804B|nr:PREDICTED: dentin sialophosphoprotein-like [Trachymyrmex cornetzi]